MAWGDRFQNNEQNGITIAVLGDPKHPPEPLLLRSLAQHPNCQHLYYIPTYPEGKAGTRNAHIIDSTKTTLQENDSTANELTLLHGVDLKAYLCAPVTNEELQAGKNTEGAALKKRLIKHILKDTPIAINTRNIDTMVSRHHRFLLDKLIKDRTPDNIFWLNDPEQSSYLDNKLYLPEARTLIPMIAQSSAVQTKADVENFLKSHGDKEMVIKSAGSIGGNAICRITRRDDGSIWCEGPPLFCDIPDPQYGQSPEGLNYFPIEHLDLVFSAPMAMEWLDSSQGDIRAVLMNGEIIGGYKRVPKEWLCRNVNETLVPINMETDLSDDDRARLKQTAETLRDHYGTNWVSADLLADKEGRHYVSEFNTGLTEDFETMMVDALHPDHEGKTDFSAKAADAIMNAAAQFKEQQQSSSAHASKAKRPGGGDLPTH